MFVSILNFFSFSFEFRFLFSIFESDCNFYSKRKFDTNLKMNSFSHHLNKRSTLFMPMLILLIYEASENHNIFFELKGVKLFTNFSMYTGISSRLSVWGGGVVMTMSRFPNLSACISDSFSLSSMNRFTFG